MLGDDPFTFPAADYANLPVELTVAGGRIVHQGARRGAARQPLPVGATVGGCGCEEMP